MKIIKPILKVVLIYVILIITFIISLSISALIPTDAIRDNVEISAEKLKGQSAAFKVGTIKKVILDNFTDAVMINNAYSVDSTKPVQSVIINSLGYNPNKGYPMKNPAIELISNLQEDDIEYYDYSRYWHGYLVYLRPLLVIFDYQTIRYLFMIILDILAGLLIYLVYKKVEKAISVILVISLLSVSYQYCGLSLTYFPVLFISIITSIYILLKREIKPTVFFIIGGLTSFLDLLTTPVLTLGVPLLMYLIVNKKEISFKMMILICLNWTLGYGMVWVSKWIIADPLYNKNIIQNALNALQERTSSNTEYKALTYTDTILDNIHNVRYEIVFIALLTIFSFIILKKEKVEISKKEIIQYLLIAIIPLVWYRFTLNHSAIHPKFTFRNMFLTIFTLLVLNYKIISKQIKRREKIEKISID